MSNDNLQAVQPTPTQEKISPADTLENPDNNKSTPKNAQEVTNINPDQLFNKYRDDIIGEAARFSSGTNKRLQELAKITA